MRKLPMMRSSKITVVKPGCAVPAIFCHREISPNTTATMSVTTPITVTIRQKGDSENEGKLLFHGFLLLFLFLFPFWGQFLMRLSLRCAMAVPSS